MFESDLFTHSDLVRLPSVLTVISQIGHGSTSLFTDSGLIL